MESDRPRRTADPPDLNCDRWLCAKLLTTKIIPNFLPRLLSWSQDAWHIQCPQVRHTLIDDDAGHSLTNVWLSSSALCL